MQTHPIGSGMLAAPFIFSLVDRIIEHPVIINHINYIGSWSLFGLVFAVNILSIIGLYLYIKTFNLLRLVNYHLGLIILGMKKLDLTDFKKTYIFNHIYNYFYEKML